MKTLLTIILLLAILIGAIVFGPSVVATYTSWHLDTQINSASRLLEKANMKLSIDEYDTQSINEAKVAQDELDKLLVEKEALLQKDKDRIEKLKEIVE